MARVDDILTLRECVEGAEASLRAGRFEEAASHIHRYLLFDEDSLHLSAKDLTGWIPALAAAVPAPRELILFLCVASSAQGRDPIKALREVQQQVQAHIRDRFHEGAEKSDGDAVRR